MFIYSVYYDSIPARCQFKHTILVVQTNVAMPVMLVQYLQSDYEIFSLIICADTCLTYLALKQHFPKANHV